MVNFSSWTTDKKLLEQVNIWYEIYIKQFSPCEKIVIDKLLNNMTFYDYLPYQNIINEYCDKLLEIYLRESKPIICTTIRDNKVHNSFFFFQAIKSDELKIIPKVEINNLKKYSEIIIIDDYSGSGGTIIKVLDRLDSTLNNKKIIIFPMIISKLGYENISSYIQNKTNNKYEILFFLKRDKRFLSEGNIFNDKEYKTFKQINEEKLNIPEKYIYGYNKSEELLSFCYYTPNNTLGVLWWEFCYDYEPFFNRDDNKKIYTNIVSDSNLKKLINKLVSNCKNEKTKKRKTIIILLLVGYNKEECINYLKVNSTFYDNSIEYFKRKKYINKYNINEPGDNINLYINYLKIRLFLIIKKSDIDFSKIVSNLNSLQEKI